MLLDEMACAHSFPMESERGGAEETSRTSDEACAATKGTGGDGKGLGSDTEARTTGMLSEAKGEDILIEALVAVVDAVGENEGDCCCSSTAQDCASKA